MMQNWIGDVPLIAHVPSPVITDPNTLVGATSCFSVSCEGFVGAIKLR